MHTGVGFPIRTSVGASGLSGKTQPPHEAVVVLVVLLFCAVAKETNNASTQRKKRVIVFGGERKIVLPFGKPLGGGVLKACEGEVP